MAETTEAQPFRDGSDARAYETEASPGRSRSPADLWLGRTLGVYRLVEAIGHGGMGVVYAAERIDGELDLRVAIKIVDRAELAGEPYRRFLLERQVLARLRHPGIAHLLDGGTTPEGVPYLVMELIEGMPITRYCRHHELDLDSRLELFSRVCRAVDYAHRNLVVHRDLKPSNILVQANGAPKLLDFGIAKLLGDPGHGESGAAGGVGRAGEVALTRADQRPGTLGYASPEQLLGEPVTTASDVYSLGVLLYELLVGHRPFAEAGDAWHAMAMLLQGHEPPSPSHSLRQTDTRPSTPRRGTGPAADPQERAKVGRGTDRSTGTDKSTGTGTRQAAWLLRWREKLGALGRALPFLDDDPEVQALRGDLDRITMKAIARQPERRYGTAAELADDLGRFRRHEPVSAAPASLTYLAKKLVRRRRGTVLAATLLLLALLGGLVARSLEARRANLERARAEAARAEAEELANFMLQDLWQGLVPIGRLDLLHPVAEKLLAYYETSLDGPAVDPTFHAGYYEALGAAGQVFLDAGMAARAVEIYQRRLELVDRHVKRTGENGRPDAPWTERRIEALHKLGFARQEAGDRDQGMRYQQEGLKLADSWLEEHPDDLPVQVLRVDMLDALGIGYYDQGRLADSRRQLLEAQQALEKLPTSAAATGLGRERAADVAEDLAAARTGNDLRLGVLDLDEGDPEKALARFDRAARRLRERTDPSSGNREELDFLLFVESLRAEALGALGRFDEAATTLESLVPNLRTSVRADPLDVEQLYQLSNALLTIADLRRRQGDRSAAERAAREVVDATAKLATKTDHIYLRDAYVRAQLVLGNARAAEPVARALLDQGWDQRGFRALWAEHGWQPPRGASGPGDGPGDGLQPEINGPE